MFEGCLGELVMEDEIGRRRAALEDRQERFRREIERSGDLGGVGMVRNGFRWVRSAVASVAKNGRTATAAS